MRFYQQLAVLAIAAGVLVGCTNNDTNNPVNPTSANYAPPTGLMALSGDGTVWLMWTASKDKDSTNFKQYQIMAMPVGGGTMVTTTAAKTATSAEVVGLTTGVAYTFTIQSGATDGTYGAESKSLVWAPAMFYRNLQLYSLLAPAATGRYSGLHIGLDNCRPVSVANAPDSVDLVFDDRGSSLDLLSPNLKSGTSLPHRTAIAGFTAYATSLTDFTVADTTVDTTSWVPAQAGLGTDDMGNGYAGKGQTFWVRTQDGYYARVFIHGDATGKLYATDGTYKYITVDVAFQPNKNLIFSRMRQNMGHASN